MFVAWLKRPLGASGQDFSASVNISRPGGGAGNVEPSRSPGGAGHSGDVGGSGGVSELQQRIHRALENAVGFTGD